MIYVALVHYPVLNRQSEVITSAVTNLDIHDISRIAATYDLSAYYVITPISDQQELVSKLISHWIDGNSPNMDRKRALSLVRICSSIQDACSQIREETGLSPQVVATSAKLRDRSIGWQELRNDLWRNGLPSDDMSPLLLLFGTASGLADEVFDMATGTLEPVEPHREYNHLSVRSAVAITLDRLLGTMS